ADRKRPDSDQPRRRQLLFGERKYMMSRFRLLFLEDDAQDAEQVRSALRQESLGADLLVVRTPEEVEAFLGHERPDVILADYAFAGGDGMAALRMAREHCPNVPFLFLSGVPGEERAVEALQNGAADYVLKQHLDRLAPAVRRAMEHGVPLAEPRRDGAGGGSPDDQVPVAPSPEVPTPR